MQDLNEDTITQSVIAQLANTSDPRLRLLLFSLVQHLHSFAREVQLSEGELMAAIQILTRIGQMCNEKRQEFILLSDTLGLSTLTMAMNNRKPVGCTEATVFGPFHVENAPAYTLGEDVANGAKGEPCFVSGVVRGLSGEPVAHARMEVWQADADGYYDVQYEGLEQSQARGVLSTDETGRYYFRSIVAEPYPIPHDGPVGEMLRATGRHPWRPAHLHFMIGKEGYQTLVTHVFRSGGKYLDSDAVFGVRSSLIADWLRHPPGTAPDGSQMDTAFYTLEYDFVLNPTTAGR
ncbi:intradiol ring-cleavage dioxygenase [Paraburkholderia hospita]|uniref:Hydroxyquinol 1,2-dioxygenase n=1 Tax=Paraburkholderia hospita TaxID=169430 RepID=A0AAN1JMW8_9BURK|nr:intradiol ring-cleavage dioxygenase [Paraburkholderia hospita]AUT76278.1 hydroxyquinol 1,2-dioxygenase [Paraburkholderia hospita]SEI17832.1 hydroxyquinol 1,2-dioxygenase [Paraburkholderia hospita]